MTYKEHYNFLMKIENIETKIYKLMEEREILKQFKIKSIVQKDNDGFKYLLAKTEYDQDLGFDYAAVYISCLMDLSSLSSEIEEFYFPFICVPEDNPSRASEYYDEKILIAHELCHIKDLLDYVELHPEYYSNLQKHGLININNFSDIKNSIKFEIDKMLITEPNALKTEYEMGHTFIPIPLLFFVKKYECETVYNYIQVQLFGHINSLISNYKDKFKDHEDEIDMIFKEVIDETESEYFQKDAFQLIVNNLKSIYKKLGVSKFQ